MKCDKFKALQKSDTGTGSFVPVTDTVMLMYPTLPKVTGSYDTGTSTEH
jgi:hypothetical protein